MEDVKYTAGDTFVVGPKTPKHRMVNAKNDNAIVSFAAIGAKDVPILIPVEGKFLTLNQLFLIDSQTTIRRN